MSVIIRPIRNPEAFASVVAVAKADGHGLVAPTHVVMKDEYVVGSLSFLPTVHIWMHTKETQVRDAIKVKEFIENHIAANGGNCVCLPCTKQSPYHPLLGKDGFINFGEYDLFVKGLK